MTGLVLELQRDALNPEIKVSNLLRKALVVSKKLGLAELEDWISKELNGYLPTDDIPKYRTVHGEVKVHNPYHGWQPIHFEDTNEAEKFSKRKISQPIGELVSLAESDSSSFQIPFSQDIQNHLMNSIGFPLQPTLITDKTKIIGVLEAVRNNILNWALELEQQGILGEGMSFSNEEKTKAQQVNYHITTNIGSMHNSQLQQDSAHASQSLNVTETNQADLKKFVEELKNSIDSLQSELSQTQFQELKTAVDMLVMQANSNSPNHILIKELGRTVRNVTEGTTGSIVASGLLAYLGLFQ